MRQAGLLVLSLLLTYLANQAPAAAQDSSGYPLAEARRLRHNTAVAPLAEANLRSQGPLPPHLRHNMAFQAAPGPMTVRMRKTVFDLGVALRFGWWALGQALNNPAAMPTAVDEMRWLASHTENAEFNAIADALQRGNHDAGALRARYDSAGQRLRHEVAATLGSEGSWYLKLGESVEALADCMPLSDPAPARRALAVLQELSQTQPKAGLPADAERALSRLCQLSTVTSDDPVAMEALYTIRRSIYKSR